MASLWGRRTLVTTVCAASAWALIGCSTPHQAPVEDRSASRAPHPVVTTTDTNKVATAASGTSPSVETRSPTYTVQPGDMLTKIGLDTGQSWHDIARWNNLSDPNHLEVGQVLRVLAPPAEATTSTTATTTTTSTTTGTATFKPLPPVAKTEGKASEPRASEPRASAAAVSPVPSAVASGTAVPLTGAATPQPPAARDSDDDLTWAWPASGPVVAPFDDAKTKGLAIGGKAGDPVYAAADGRVVYAGSGLRGYGNLVIVKHNANYLTAYAHNQTLLVKEDQIVKRGQKIAEMGATDADRVQLHFEIRKQGKPIDPARLLPPR
jgi:lipoprotein NlpD